jgi:hypothetical protein
MWIILKSVALLYCFALLYESGVFHWCFRIGQFIICGLVQCLSFIASSVLCCLCCRRRRSEPLLPVGHGAIHYPPLYTTPTSSRPLYGVPAQTGTHSFPHSQSTRAPSVRITVHSVGVGHRASLGPPVISVPPRSALSVTRPATRTSTTLRPPPLSTTAIASNEPATLPSTLPSLQESARPVSPFEPSDTDTAEGLRECAKAIGQQKKKAAFLARARASTRTEASALRRRVTEYKAKENAVNLAAADKFFTGTLLPCQLH